MTREEREKAIKTLQKLQADYNDNYIDYEGANDAYKMAIEALQTEPCEDAISRQAVLSEIETVCFSKTWSKFRADNGSNGTRDYIINYIKQLPPVQPAVCIAKITMTDEQVKEAFEKAKCEILAAHLEQKEITMEDVKGYCESRNLVVISKDLFHKMINTADEIYIYLKDKEDENEKDR